jgi:hypothetical protein
MHVPHNRHAHASELVAEHTAQVLPVRKVGNGRSERLRARLVQDCVTSEKALIWPPRTKCFLTPPVRVRSLALLPKRGALP